MADLASAQHWFCPQWPQRSRSHSNTCHLLYVEMLPCPRPHYRPYELRRGANLIKPVRSTPPSQLHTKCSDFTILTSLHLIWDGFELKWWYCCTLDLLLCHTTMEHGHRATILHSMSVIRCHRAGRAAPSLCGYCKVWRESHPSIACPHLVTITTVGGTHAHISMHCIKNRKRKKMLHPDLLPLLYLSFSFCECPQQLHRDEEQEAFQLCDRSSHS